MTTIKERFDCLIKHYSNGNKSKFASKIGVAHTVIENIVGVRGGNPSFSLLRNLFDAFPDVNQEWLIAGKGNMLKPPALITEAEISKQDKEVAEGKWNAGTPVSNYIFESEAYQSLYNKYTALLQELESKKNAPAQENSHIIEKLFQRLESQSEKIGRLEAENAQLKKYTGQSTDYAVSTLPALNITAPPPTLACK